MFVKNQKFKTTLLSSCVLALGLASTGVNGQEAHVHGAASLNIAALEGAVLIEFTSPAANLVGFENKADSKKQRQQVLEAGQILENGTDLFAFSGANCKLAESENNLKDVLLEDHDGHHDDHDDDHKDHHKGHDKYADKHHDDDHKDHHKDHDKHADKHHDDDHKDHHKGHDKHADKHHDGHYDDQHHDDHDEEAHSDIAATYEFTCAKGQLPSAIDVQLIKRFSGIETLTTEWVTASQQGAVALNQTVTRVSLK